MSTRSRVKTLRRGGSPHPIRLGLRGAAAMAEEDVLRRGQFVGRPGSPGGRCSDPGDPGIQRIAERDSRRSKRTRPASGGKTPPHMRISVDLPAPFSPTSACTSPRGMARLTFSSRMNAAEGLGDAFEFENRHRSARGYGHRLGGDGEKKTDIRIPLLLFPLGPRAAAGAQRLPLLAVLGVVFRRSSQASPRPSRCR